MSNSTYRLFVEKLGGTTATEFVGNVGDVFYDPEGNELRISDGSTVGGLVLSGGGGPTPTEWVRPSDWLEMPEVTGTDETFVGLRAIYYAPANFAAVLFEGDYTVDWGDGTVEDFDSGVKAQHNYDWAEISEDTLTSEGYKQVIIVVTPQSGQQLTSINLNVFHDNYSDYNYSDNGWLDLSLSMPNANSIDLGGALPG